jgi:TorA maturation chaperone TorD
VRADLHALGLVRTEGLFEPEDHIAFLFEIMAALIRGAANDDITDIVFFRRHIQGWSERLFADIAHAEAAQFYRPVAALARLLVDLETQAAELPV